MKSRLRVGLLVSLLLATACRDDTTAPRLDDHPPESFRITGPDVIVQGRAFELTITALDEAGAPDLDWSGPVALESSAGTVTPATVQVVGGSVTIQATLDGHAGEVTLLAANGSAESDPLALTVLSGAAPSRIEIVPSTALLTAAGETHSFGVRAFDAQGTPTTVDDVEWRTTNAGVLTIDDTGVATALSGVGSAQIVATADGMESAPALVLVADPTPDAVLLPDSQIVSDPVAVSATAEYGPGWQYRVRVRGAAPAIGDLVIGTGQRALAGRVVAATPIGGERDLTVEIVPLNELFASLAINATIPLVETEPENSGGGRIGQGAVRHALAAVEFKRAGFDCIASADVPLELPEPDPDVNGSLALQLVYGDGVERFVVQGDISAEIEYRPVLTAAFEGKLECKRTFKTFTVPITGWLSLFFGLQVPVGIGFELNGKVEIAEVGFDVAASASARAELGFACPSGGACSSLTTFDAQRDGSFEFISPDPSEQFRVELGAHGYVFANLAIGSVWDAAQLELVAATAGLEQTVNLATTHEQVADTVYASDFALNGRLVIGAGESITSALKKLGDLTGNEISVNLNVVDDTAEIAKSPAGTFTITPETVEPGDTTGLGDMATFKVELDPVTYLGLSSVDRVEFFWKHEDEEGEFTLGPGRPACTDVAASAGQTTFECETDFLDTTSGEQTFYAFVHAELFGVPLPLPLEIAPDGKATVSVASECSASPPDYEYYGPAGVFMNNTEDDGGGTVTAEIIAAEPHHLSYSAEIEADSSGNWISARGDMYVDDYIMIQPLESFSGFLTLHMDVFVRGEQSEPDDYVDVTVSASNSLGTVGINLEGRPEDPLVAQRDTTVSVLLDNDVTRIDGEWIRLRHFITAYVRTRGGERTGAVSAESRMDILDHATDSDGKSIPIQVCSAMGASY